MAMRLIRFRISVDLIVLDKKRVALFTTLLIFIYPFLLGEDPPDEDLLGLLDLDGLADLLGIVGELLLLLYDLLGVDLSNLGDDCPWYLLFDRCVSDCLLLTDGLSVDLSKRAVLASELFKF